MRNEGKKKEKEPVEEAYEQEENWTAATLQALSLEILEDFDMELDLENNDVERD